MKVADQENTKYPETNRESQLRVGIIPTCELAISIQEG